MPFLVGRNAGPIDPETRAFFHRVCEQIPGRGSFESFECAAYRQDPFRRAREGSAGASICAYRTAQATFEWPRLFGRAFTVGSQVIWNDFTQISYFGTGPASLDAMRTQYRIRYADAIGYATAQLSDVLSLEISGGSLTCRSPLSAASGCAPCPRGRARGRAEFSAAA